MSLLPIYLMAALCLAQCYFALSVKNWPMVLVYGGLCVSNVGMVFMVK